MKKNRILTFLWVSLICLAALCVAVFGVIARVMVKRSDRTLTQVANLYMEEINGQLQRHFDSLVEMQLSQVEGITLAVPPSSVDTLDATVVNTMTTAGRARDFAYLALYNTEGKADVIYGEPVTIREEDAFLASLHRAVRPADDLPHGGSSLQVHRLCFPVPGGGGRGFGGGGSGRLPAAGQQHSGQGHGQQVRALHGDSSLGFLYFHSTSPALNCP
nr:hypothetical protein [uncultured Gemmiger sp.]